MGGCDRVPIWHGDNEGFGGDVFVCVWGCFTTIVSCAFGVKNGSLVRGWGTKSPTFQLRG